MDKYKIFGAVPVRKVPLVPEIFLTEHGTSLKFQDFDALSSPLIFSVIYKLKSDFYTQKRISEERSFQWYTVCHAIISRYALPCLKQKKSKNLHP